MNSEVSRPPVVVGVVGNPKPRSRTYSVVATVAEQVAGHAGGSVAAMLDLIELKDELFAFGGQAVGAALEQVLGADWLIIGSPVYKATYTGLLKAFCDHIGHAQLHGKLAVPLMVGGAPNHALAVEVHLRPLLVELGATCTTPGLYILETDVERVGDIAAEYLAGLSWMLPRPPLTAR